MPQGMPVPTGEKRQWATAVAALLTIAAASWAMAGDPVAVAEPEGFPPAVEFLGFVAVQREVVEPDGSRTPVAEISGVSWLGGDRYLAAMDSSDRLLLLTLAAPAGAKPSNRPLPEESVRLERTIEVDAARDWEDVAAGAIDGPDRWVHVVEEDTPAIRSFLVEGLAGENVGRAGVPDVVSLATVFRTARANRGPESLTLDPDSLHLWTANEEPLERDGPAVADGRTAWVRLVRLPIGTGIEAAGEQPPKTLEWIYRIDPPHGRVGPRGGPLYCGVVALVALGQGRLIVLERSAAAGVPPFESRLFLVDSSTETPTDDSVGSDDPDSIAVAKTLLWRGALGVNLEALCAGPRLPDGRRLLVGAADNGGVAGKNQLALFTLADPGPALTSP
jgi:hypothetical protein